MNSCSTGLIDLTQAVWGPRMGRVLTVEEAHDIVGNLTGFFSTLHRLSLATASSS